MENEIIKFPQENIFMEFKIGEQNYAVIGSTDKLDEENGDEVYFVKVDIVDGEKIARNIENHDELVKAEQKFYDTLYSLEEGEENV